MRLLLVATIPLSLGFAPPTKNRVKHPSLKSNNYGKTPMPLFSPPSTTSLGLFDLFRKNKRDDEDKPSASEDEPVKEEEKESTPFFARMLGGDNDNESKEDPLVVETRTATLEPPARVPPPPPPAPEPVSAMEQAQALKAQAERMRLEAEKANVQLTLEKIEKLEKKMASLKDSDDDKREKLQAEMEMLQARMRGEEPAPKIIPAKSTSVKEPAASKSVASASNVTTGSNGRKTYGGILSEMEGLLPFNETEFQFQLEEFKQTPNFLKSTLANAVAVDFDSVEDINATEVALRVEKMERKDYSFLANVSKPVFSQSVIAETEATIRAIENDKIMRDIYSDIFVDAADGNVTALAIMVLEEKYYNRVVVRSFAEKNFGVKIPQDGRWASIFGGKDDFTVQQQVAAAFFPKSCRKEGQSPTEAQAKILASEVLPKANFMPSAKPIPVLDGGFIIRGVNKSKKGADSLMEDIEKLVEKSMVADKLSVFYVKDFTVFANDELLSFENEPVMVVTGPDVTRDKRPVAFTLVSLSALATSWYLSVYPFLLNSATMKQVDEQMQLANAGMDYNLSWLTQGATPLFASFIGIQLAHEVGHLLGAAIHGTKLQVPTFVPSIIAGMTSTVTTFQEPPKNFKAMFDFAIAGPLMGIAASLAALYFGMQMTTYVDPESYAAFPALPLEILRQSTLGGGVVEYFLGNGALSIPDGAEGTAAVAGITIPLHPVAIAGYIGLMVNALSLLPIGTTDGGRISMTLFGRGIKQTFGMLFLTVLFFLGLFGSDLFLFYCSFLIFFQTGNEIPSLNEVDDLDFGRVLLAIAAGVLSLLVLVPMS